MQVYYITWCVEILLLMLVTRFDNNEYKGMEYRYTHSAVSKFFYFISAAILIFVAGCRYGVGADYFAYYNGYAVAAREAINNLLSLNEPGLYLIYWIAVKVSNTPEFCMFLTAAVTIGLSMFALYRTTEDIGTSTILFMFVVWHTCFNGMRQALAAAVLMYGIRYLWERNLPKYLFIVALAFMCHKSAAVMALLYFAVHGKMKAANIIITLVLALIILRSYEQVMNLTGLLMNKADYVSLYDVTSNNYLSRSVNFLRIAFEVVPFVLFMILFMGKLEDEVVSFNLNILLMHAVVAITTSGSAYLARMSLYTMPMAIVAITKLQSRLSNTNKRIVQIVMLFMFAFFGWYEIKNNGTYANFRWIWSAHI